MKSLAIFAIGWVLAILTIVLLSDEHRPPNAGLPVVKTAMPVAPDHPISWRLNSVCTIDEHKTQEIVDA